jgi:hypothetical protein
MGLQKTPDTLRRINIERDKTGSVATRSGPGFVPWNKGKRDEYRLSHGAPLGTLRKKMGYWQRKVSMDGPWMTRWQWVHVLMWESAHGAVPDGYLVTFKNGDGDDIALDNLVLLSKADNLARQSAHTFGPELFRLMQLRGAITRQLNKRKETP